MTNDEIITIAKEVGFVDEEIDKCKLMFERFAFLVAKQERKACAKIVDENIGFENYLSEIIRSRG
jgi:hypothetical protein